MSGFTHPEYLVETDWLAQNLNNPDVLVLDCTTHLIPDPKITYQVKPGREDFEKGHIPGAQFVDMLRDVSDTSQSLRFMRQSPDDFAAAMRRFGVNNTTRVVTYSTANVWWATRLWWLLHEFGYDNAAVLNGGWQKWQHEGRPVETGPGAVATSRQLHRARGAQPDGRQGRGAARDRRWRDLHDQRAAAGSSIPAAAATATAGRDASRAASTCPRRICSIRRPTRSCPPTNCASASRRWARWTGR